MVLGGMGRFFRYFRLLTILVFAFSFKYDCSGVPFGFNIFGFGKSESEKLFEAINSNKQDDINKILKKAEENGKLAELLLNQHKDTTPLKLACDNYNNEANINAKENREAIINIIINWMINALFQAINSNKQDDIKQILEAANANGILVELLTKALFYAINSNKQDDIKQILEAANVNGILVELLTNALFQAINSNNQRGIKQILEVARTKGKLVELLTNALFQAINNGNKDQVKQILGAANANGILFKLLTNKQGSKTPLQLACSMYNTEKNTIIIDDCKNIINNIIGYLTSEWLYAVRSIPNGNDRMKKIWDIIANEDIAETYKKICNNDINDIKLYFLEIKNFYGLNVLHLAAIFGNPKCIEFIRNIIDHVPNLEWNYYKKTNDSWGRYNTNPRKISIPEIDTDFSFNFGIFREYTALSLAKEMHKDLQDKYKNNQNIDINKLQDIFKRYTETIKLLGEGEDTGNQPDDQSMQISKYINTDSSSKPTPPGTNPNGYPLEQQTEALFAAINNNNQLGIDRILNEAQTKGVLLELLTNALFQAIKEDNKDQANQILNEAQTKGVLVELLNNVNNTNKTPLQLACNKYNENDTNKDNREDIIQHIIRCLLGEWIFTTTRDTNGGADKMKKIWDIITNKDIVETYKKVCNNDIRWYFLNLIHFYGLNVLHFAAIYGNTECIKFIKSICIKDIIDCNKYKGMQTSTNTNTNTIITNIISLRLTEIDNFTALDIAKKVLKKLSEEHGQNAPEWQGVYDRYSETIRLLEEGEDTGNQPQQTQINKDSSSKQTQISTNPDDHSHLYKPADKYTINLTNEQSQTGTNSAGQPTPDKKKNVLYINKDLDDQQTPPGDQKTQINKGSADQQSQINKDLTVSTDPGDKQTPDSKGPNGYPSESQAEALFEAIKEGDENKVNEINQILEDAVANGVLVDLLTNVSNDDKTPLQLACEKWNENDINENNRETITKNIINRLFGEWIAATEDINGGADKMGKIWNIIMYGNIMQILNGLNGLCSKLYKCNNILLVFFTYCSKGLNVLHWAAIFGNPKCIKFIKECTTGYINLNLSWDNYRRDRKTKLTESNTYDITIDKIFIDLSDSEFDTLTALGLAEKVLLKLSEKYGQPISKWQGVYDRYTETIRLLEEGENDSDGEIHLEEFLADNKITPPLKSDNINTMAMDLFAAIEEGNKDKVSKILKEAVANGVLFDLLTSKQGDSPDDKTPLELACKKWNENDTNKDNRKTIIFDIIGWLLGEWLFTTTGDIDDGDGKMKKIWNIITHKDIMQTFNGTNKLCSKFYGYSDIRLYFLLNPASPYGLNVLHWAAIHGNTKCIEFIKNKYIKDIIDWNEYKEKQNDPSELTIKTNGIYIDLSKFNNLTALGIAENTLLKLWNEYKNRQSNEWPGIYERYTKTIKLLAEDGKIYLRKFLSKYPGLTKDIPSQAPVIPQDIATDLFAAIKEGNKDKVEKILKGVENDNTLSLFELLINTKDDGKTPLGVARSMADNAPNMDSIIKIIIDYLAKAIFQAIDNNNKHQVKQILRNVKENLRLYPLLIIKTNSNKQTPLAAICGKWNINDIDDQDACDVVKLIIDYFISDIWLSLTYVHKISLENVWNITTHKDVIEPLNKFCKEQYHYDDIRLLFLKHMKDGYNVLHWAALQGEGQCVKFIKDIIKNGKFLDWNEYKDIQTQNNIDFVKVKKALTIMENINLTKGKTKDSKIVNDDIIPKGVTALEIAEIILEAIKDNNKVDAKIKADYVEVIRQLKDFDEDLDKLLKAIETNDVNDADSIIKGYHNPHVFILLVDTKSKSSKYKGHSALTYSMTKSNEAAQRVKGAIRHLWFNAPRNKSNNLFPGVKIMGSIFSQINDQINKLSTQQLKLRSLLLLISLFDGYSYNSKMNILHIAAVLGNHDCVSFIRKKMIDPSSKIGINWNIYKRKITPSNATMTINLNENEPNSNENESKPKGKECDVKNKSPLELAIFGLNLANLDKLNKIQKDIDDFNEIISLLMQKCLAINMGSTSEPTSHQGELFDIINGDPILKDIDFIGKKHETEPKLLYYTPPLVVGKFEMKENINTKDYITANFNNLPDFIKNNENVKNFIENIKSIKNNKKLTLALVIQRPFKQQDSFNDNSNQLRIVNVNNENTINEGKEVKEILHGELSFFQKVINNVYHFIESLFVPVSKSEECTYKWVDGVGNFFIFSNSDGQPVITYHWITSKITCAFIENELDNLNYKSTKYGYLNVIHNDNNSDDTRVIMAKICSLGNAIDRGIYEILSIRGLEGKKVESLKISDIIDLKNKKHELSYKAVLIIELIEESLDTYYKTEWRQLNSANDSLLPDSIISMLTNLQSNINIVTAILDNTFNLSDNDDDNKYKKNTTANTSFDHINDNVTNGKAKTLLIPFRTTTFYGSAAIPIIETREIEMAPADN